MTSTATLEVDVMDDVPKDDGFVRDWRRLAVAAENPFCTPEWHRSWLCTQSGVQPLVLAVRDHGELVGVFASAVRRVGGVAVIEPPGGNLTDYSGLACDAQSERRIGGAVLHAMSGVSDRWDVLRLNRCIAGSGWEDALLNADSERTLVVRPWRSEVLVSVPLEAGVSPLLKGRDRREVNRLGRRLVELHGAGVRMSAGPVVASDVRHLLRLREARWETSSQPEEDFLADVAQRLSDVGLLQFRVLEASGRMIAGLLGFKLHGRSFAYLMAFDASYATAGPGNWMLTSAVLDAAARGDHTFDMLRGDEGHKRPFRNQHREARTYLVARPRSVAAAAVRAAVAGRGAYHQIPKEYRNLLRAKLQSASSAARNVNSKAE